MIKEYRKAKFNDIYEDVQDSDEKKKYLKLIAAADMKGVRPSFFTIKKKYFEKFYPELLPKAQKKASTMFDMIDEL